MQILQMPSEASMVCFPLLIVSLLTFWLCRLTICRQHSGGGQYPSDPTVHLCPVLAQHILDEPEMQHKWDCVYIKHNPTM